MATSAYFAAFFITILVGVTGNDFTPYVLTPERLAKISAQLMYPYFDTGGPQGNGDLEENIKNTNPQINKQFIFLLPFFGFGYNYTWLSLNGFLSFSDFPDRIEYPLKFPIPDWPNSNDPSFIGPWYSRCLIGKLRGDEADKRKPGVYFRLERNLPDRQDQFAVELRERLKSDLRESMVGTEDFEPRHAFIATWKNISFAGGYNTLQTTNTFQAVVTTDEVRTYAIFNYQYLTWTTSTEAGGDINHGLGGVPAFVGFNAGNGTQAYEYSPYSQGPKIMHLLTTGNANGFPGRHVFRIDEKIEAGVCGPDYYLNNQPLTAAPKRGNMLGGTMVNVTGPCLKPNTRITCRFGIVEVGGKVVDQNRASCIMPQLRQHGMIHLALAIDGGPFIWKTTFYAESPTEAGRFVWVEDPEEVFATTSPTKMTLRWKPSDLSADPYALVDLRLWATRKEGSTQVTELQVLETGIPNSAGSIVLSLDDYIREKTTTVSDYAIGLITVSLMQGIHPIPPPTTTPLPRRHWFGNCWTPKTPQKTLSSTLATSNTHPRIWSKPFPVSIFDPKRNDSHFSINTCNEWLQSEAVRPAVGNYHECPCHRDKALALTGQLSLPPCGLWGPDADLAFNSAQPKWDGSGAFCAYNTTGDFIPLSEEDIWGSRSERAHPLTDPSTLAHWTQDVFPFFHCCLWQNKNSQQCQVYRFNRTLNGCNDMTKNSFPASAWTTDMKELQVPSFQPFDRQAYLFNMIGDYVLQRARGNELTFDVQVRLEPINDAMARAVSPRFYQITGVAVSSNNTPVVELRLRRPVASIFFRMDILVDSKPIYLLEETSQQYFPGLAIYRHENDVCCQEDVVVAMDNGVGVRVTARDNRMSLSFSVPSGLASQMGQNSRGLLGTLNFDPDDDFTIPNGAVLSPDTDPVEFAKTWEVTSKLDPLKGQSLFHNELIHFKHTTHLD